MKKIYYVAIKWDKTHDEDNYKYVITTQAREGDDIAGFTQCYTYREGWRIYSFTTKKARDNLVHYTLNKGVKE